MGVVGADGACNVCGRIDPEAARRIDARDARDARRADDEGGADGTNSAAPAEEGAAASAGATDAGSRAAAASGGPAGDEWQERKLCVDGACIGVVSDGRCNTCGKAQ